MMVCDATQELYLLTAIVVGVIGALVTVMSVVSVAANSNLPQSVRVILLSFSVANVTGTTMLTHDTLKFLCQRHQFTPLTTISVMLSVTHLLLLMLSTHISKNKKQENSNKARNYIGLILISWFISISMGTINVITRLRQKKLIFSIVFLFIVLYSLAQWLTAIKTYKIKEKLRINYQLNFLDEHPLRPKEFNRKCWEMKHVNSILISYLSCATPWVLNQFQEGLELFNSIYLLEFGILVIYTLNFFFPSCVMVYLTVMARRKRTEIDEDKINFSAVKLSFV